MMQFKIAHVRRTVSYMLLAKSMVGGAFALLTLCGVTAPFVGIDFTPAREASAAGVGGMLGLVLISLKA